MTFVKAGLANTSLRPWIEAFARTAQLVFMLQPVQLRGSSVVPACSRTDRWPQDQQVRGQCGEHGLGFDHGVRRYNPFMI